MAEMVIIFVVAPDIFTVMIPVVLGSPERRLKYTSTPELFKLMLEIVAGEIIFVILLPVAPEEKVVPWKSITLSVWKCTP